MEVLVSLHVTPTKKKLIFHSSPHRLVNVFTPASLIFLSVFLALIMPPYLVFQPLPPIIGKLVLWYVNIVATEVQYIY